ncbi:MAG: translation elongation factor Ts [Candidatus Caldatribacteriota bacterium]|nr:translation elongation factor Ts [Candidatus Caldatribacteriota bacterium]
MNITAKMVQELRRKTSAGIMDCKKALKENGGNLEKSIEYLRKKGINAAASKSNRKALSGKIQSYIHLDGKIGVLIEINCETDFVAKTEIFNEFAKDISLQIAALDPKYISREEVQSDVLEKEKDIFRTQAEKSKKPAAVIERIVKGKIEKYYQETCLVDQTFIKDSNKNIKTLLLETIAKLGENIVIRKFARFKLGEDS